MIDANPGLGALADNIVHFARVLRRAGVPVGPAAVVDAVRAVEIAGMATRDDFYWTLHAIFATRREHHAVFDEAFRLFWQRRRGLARTLAETVDDDEGASPAPTKPASRRIAEAFSAARTISGTAGRRAPRSSPGWPCRARKSSAAATSPR